MEKKSISIGIIIIVAAVVIFGGILAYQYFSSQKTNSQPEVQNTQQIQQQPATSTQQQANNVQPANQTQAPASTSLKTFKDHYGFQMQYPADSSVMNAPTSKIVACNNSCPTDLKVNNIDSIHANQTVNGVNYCVYSGGTAGNGHLYYNEFLYLTVSNGTCYGLDFSWSDVNCSDSATDAMVKSCRSKEGASQALISEAVSTIRFTPIK